jgi:hypothetical protein
MSSFLRHGEKGKKRIEKPGFQEAESDFSFVNAIPISLLGQPRELDSQPIDLTNAFFPENKEENDAQNSG